jgi:hypothetical protein
MGRSVLGHPWDPAADALPYKPLVLLGKRGQSWTHTGPRFPTNNPVNTPLQEQHKPLTAFMENGQNTVAIESHLFGTVKLLNEIFYGRDPLAAFSLLPSQHEKPRL